MTASTAAAPPQREKSAAGHRVAAETAMRRYDADTKNVRAGEGYRRFDTGCNISADHQAFPAF
jgi:hypothetical protein